MIHSRTAILAGVCTVCLGLQFGAADIGHAVSAVEASGSYDARITGFTSPQFFSDQMTERSVARLPIRLAQQENDGNSSKPAWAAEATMNPDYVNDGAAAAAPAAEEPQVADASASTGGQATTSFYGDTKPTGTPAWAEEAKMNPNYNKDEAAAPAAQPAAAAAEEAAPASLGGQATTSFYGGSKPTGTPAWAEEAKMNPDYSSGASSSGSATAPEPAAADSVRSAAVEECRSAVTTAVKDARLFFNEAGFGLSAEARAALNKVARALKTCGAVMVEIAGHTDSVGSPESNKTLSAMRAKEVVEFLVGAGVDSSKLKAVGHGQENPVADNSSANGRAKNRRVEVQITTGQ
ncbi:flagellar motor protein MotB [Hyphomicrobium methylovorum]|uniref:OmpA family protein n=1 Tax=Hyphomicrobium methylovorum TaxID=84 RepID=UPI0015E6818D|nr:OmpA family protein [Hyphomicrobium methylovorum]MBA2126228.1 flagellar motor protein MotB [Hyphomicrobium methylovorum]